MNFLTLEDYEIRKAKFKLMGLEFREEFTTKRRCIVTNRGTRYYLEHTNEDLFQLGMHEMGIMHQVKKEAVRALSRGAKAPYNKHKSNYMAYSPKIEEGLIYSNIAQIDINSAYLSAAKNRGFISERTYNRFFEIEDNDKRIAKKASMKEAHLKQYLTKDGEILKYSKKSRLISLGRLAQHKEINYYSPYEEKNGYKIENGKIKEDNKKNESGKSKLIKTEERFNENEANIFFTCSYDVDSCLLDCMELDGVFFYWVDAIFCDVSKIREVQRIIRSHGFESKIKYHDFLTMRDNFIFVDTGKKAKKYSFNKYKRLDNVWRQSDIEEKFNTTLEDYKQLMNCDYSEQINLVSSALKVSKSAVKKFCDDTGYKPINYLIFLDLCEILDIESVNDFNFFYLCKKLNDSGLNLNHFVRMVDVNIQNIKKDNLNLLLKTVIFFHSEKETKMREIHKEADRIFGKRITSKELAKLENFELISEEEIF